MVRFVFFTVLLIFSQLVAAAPTRNCQYQDVTSVFTGSSDTQMGACVSGSASIAFSGNDLKGDIYSRDNIIVQSRQEYYKTNYYDIYSQQNCETLEYDSHVNSSFFSNYVNSPTEQTTTTTPGKTTPASKSKAQIIEELRGIGNGRSDIFIEEHIFWGYAPNGSAKKPYHDVPRSWEEFKEGIKNAEAELKNKYQGMNNLFDDVIAKQGSFNKDLLNFDGNKSILITEYNSAKKNPEPGKVEPPTTTTTNYKLRWEFLQEIAGIGEKSAKILVAHKAFTDNYGYGFKKFPHNWEDFKSAIQDASERISGLENLYNNVIENDENHFANALKFNMADVVRKFYGSKKFDRKSSERVNLPSTIESTKSFNFDLKLDALLLSGEAISLGVVHGCSKADSFNSSSPLYGLSVSAKGNNVTVSGTRQKASPSLLVGVPVELSVSSNQELTLNHFENATLNDPSLWKDLAKNNGNITFTITISKEKSWWGSQDKATSRTVTKVINAQSANIILGNMSEKGKITVSVSAALNNSNYYNNSSVKLIEKAFKIK